MDLKCLDFDLDNSGLCMDILEDIKELVYLHRISIAAYATPLPLASRLSYCMLMERSIGQKQKPSMLPSVTVEMETESVRCIEICPKGYIYKRRPQTLEYVK